MGGAWRRIAAVGAAVLAAACASSGEYASPRAGAYKIGQPYTVNGTNYVPREQPDYDTTGVASWYGAKFHGRLTANGEVFDRNKLTAAHPTLPLPTQVRVTNVENGRSVVLRVNDRGPFIGDRIIDVSERAAEMLGFRNNGLANVQVTLLGSADGKQKPGVERPEREPEAAPVIAAAPVPPVHASVVAPLPAPAQATEPAVAFLPAGQAPAVKALAVEHRIAPTPLFVQAGAFSSLANANRAMDALKELGASISALMKDGHALYRVRLGPFTSISDAGAALVHVQQLGHNDARIVVD
ncbi:MAG: septal ring lytic transglycosylase RlpA family protein [Alphaproteobacteria bacterium]